MIGGNRLEDRLPWVLSDLAIDRESYLLNGNRKAAQVDNFDTSHITCIHAITVNEIGFAVPRQACGLRYDTELYTALIYRVPGVDYAQHCTESRECQSHTVLCLKSHTKRYKTCSFRNEREFAVLSA